MERQKLVLQVFSPATLHTDCLLVKTPTKARKHKSLCVLSELNGFEKIIKQKQNE
jgi:hypothetical protein